jgi:hypothetical protein
MAQPLSINDPALRQAISEALSRRGELLVFIRHNLGLREWWLVSDESELDQALRQATGNNERSDAIELYTGEFPHRGSDTEALKRTALEVVKQTDVVLAARHDGDPRLADVEETDEIEFIDEWFRKPHEGQVLVGSHPLLTHDDFWPDVDDCFLAYSELPDGTVRPGSY